MTKKELQIIKNKILKCLTEDFTYGKTKTGKPLKHRRINQALFDKKQGYACFDNTDLGMITDKVLLGLYFAMDEINKE